MAYIRALFTVVVLCSLLLLWIYSAFPNQGPLIHSLRPSNFELPFVTERNVSHHQLGNTVNEDEQTKSEVQTTNKPLHKLETSTQVNGDRNRKFESVKKPTLINQAIQTPKTEREQRKTNKSEGNNRKKQQETLTITHGRIIGDAKQENVKANSESNITHVQERNKNSRVQENRLFSFNESEFGSLKYSLKDNQMDRYGKSADFDNNSHKDYITEVLKFDEATLISVEGYGRQVLLYSAILSNSSKNNTWDRLSIHGWEAMNLSEQVYSCCLLYESGIIKVVPLLAKIKRPFKVALSAKQFICNISNLNDFQMEFPSSVTLTSTDKLAQCPTRDDMYKKIDYAYKHPGEFAIFGKIIYGDMSGKDLLAWFEIHRLMGADKIVFYPFKLGRNATKVLRFYQNLGVAEIVPFAFPSRAYYERGAKGLYHGYNFFNHQEVAIMDGLERLQGYKYMASFDTDEYLVPTKIETLKSLFDRLFRKYPDAAGFTFGTYLYITDWKPASNESIFTVGAYLSRTDLTSDRNKHYVLPERVRQTFTHKFAPKKTFRGYRVLEADAAIRHYRRCRHSYQGRKETCFQFQRYMDNHLYRVFKPIEKRVLRLKQHLGV